METYTEQQYEKIFRLCDVLALQDIIVATTILQETQWDLEKALSQVYQGNTIPKQPQAYIPPEQPAKPSESEEEFQNLFENDDSFNNFEYDYDYAYSELEQKKNRFDQQYASFPLRKTTSQTPNSLEKGVSHDRHLSQDQKFHQHAYRLKLMANSEILYARILQSHPEEKRRAYENNRKIANNRRFIGYLYKHYKPKINFTFGTLLLNLVRSYLEKKFLLVYIHKDGQASNKLIEMLLTQRQTAKFVNEHCVAYGMFDNSDDYDIVQRYVPMGQVPAFALFSLDKKKQVENYMSHYTVIRKDPSSFLEWLAREVGVSIKKKQPEASPEKPTKAEEKAPEYTISEIVNQQNYEYEEMEKMYFLKREKSKFEKEEIADMKARFQKLSLKFEKEPEQKAGQVIAVRLRLPLTGKSVTRNFLAKNLIKEIFDYVSCFGREEFENPYGDFDLTQTFPRISLREHMSKKISEVFPDSEHENIIVKEL